MVAQPTLTYDQSYFNGGVDANGLVYGYSNYASPETYLAERPAQLVAGYVNHLAVSGKVVLIVGCAYGLTVQALRAQGVTAWGMDISSYAISQVPADTTAYVMTGDARQSSVWNTAKSMAGLKGHTTFDVVITEDMLACLSNADASTVSSLARSNSKSVFHLVDVAPAAWYNDNSAATWKSLLTPDAVVERFTWVVH